MAARAARRENRERGAEIGPDETDAVALFHALSSQWRVHPMGGRMGFEYAAIGPTAALMGIEMTAATFADLRVMEGAALAAFPRP
ncbi:hypothetical protein ASE73_02550 [Sphingomonas sp. Leaf24]|uniref:DUF1799 domain-containing protein n=1 Tax=unclassified Sphingomonas TaxID=196159 RepID=UPI0006FFAA72|nr:MULTISPECIES: DUF1799 domain-containing protein [unclassified Sphingomonas]KQM23123.1 hypothetical protein ASE50_02550 [Sphingomonas sp. Leaf5]KQM95981.1 hypothetical protein ASE73_02550 [Sphingomonas sp. Leaf24]